MAKNHRDDRKHICLVCGAGFKQHSYLGVHIKKVQHDYSLKTLACDICDEKMYSKLQIE